jgi:hypothetical protein
VLVAVIPVLSLRTASSSSQCNHSFADRVLLEFVLIIIQELRKVENELSLSLQKELTMQSVEGIQELVLDHGSESNESS